VPTLEIAATNPARLLDAPSGNGFRNSPATATVFTGPKREGDPGGPRNTHCDPSGPMADRHDRHRVPEMLRCIPGGACIEPLPGLSVVGGHALWLGSIPADGVLLSPCLLVWDERAFCPSLTFCGPLRGSLPGFAFPFAQADAATGVNRILRNNLSPGACVRFWGCASFFLRGTPSFFFSWQPVFQMRVLARAGSCGRGRLSSRLRSPRADPSIATCPAPKAAPSSRAGNPGGAPDNERQSRNRSLIPARALGRFGTRDDDTATKLRAAHGSGIAANTVPRAHALDDAGLSNCSRPCQKGSRPRVAPCPEQSDGPVRSVDYLRGENLPRNRDWRPDVTLDAAPWERTPC